MLQNALSKLRNKQPITIVVQGDSNTLVSMNTQGRMNWVGLLTEALWERYGDGLVTMINVSKCGFAFAALSDVLDEQILRWHPDLVIFQTWLGGPIDPTSGRREAGRVALRDAVARMRAANPAIDVLVCTPNPRVLCPGHILPDGAEAGAVCDGDDWNSAHRDELVAAAEEAGCTVVDHFAAWQRKQYRFAHPGANPRGLWQRMVDPVHPNAAGHMAMFRELAPRFDVAKHFLWEETDERA